MQCTAMFGTLIAAGIPLVTALAGVGIVTAGTTALAARSPRYPRPPLPWR